MTIISIAFEESAEAVARVRALLDDVARTDINWNGAVFQIVRDDFTGIEGDESAAAVILYGQVCRALDAQPAAAAFYLIESQYVGPGQTEAGNLDRHTIGIYSAPARGNMSGEPIIEGWAGTTNDVSVNAHGRYETDDAARAQIARIVGAVRDDETAADANAGDLIERYLVGRYEPMGRQSTGDWVADSLRADVTAATTDAQLAALAAEYGEAANAEGATLDGDLPAMMQAFRDDLAADSGAD